VLIEEPPPPLPPRRRPTQQPPTARRPTYAAAAEAPPFAAMFAVNGDIHKSCWDVEIPLRLIFGHFLAHVRCTRAVGSFENLGGQIVINRLLSIYFYSGKIRGLGKQLPFA
jgi:hypothetical protein